MQLSFETPKALILQGCDFVPKVLIFAPLKTQCIEPNKGPKSNSVLRWKLSDEQQFTHY
jgi:hypothetical protein